MTRCLSSSCGSDVIMRSDLRGMAQSGLRRLLWEQEIEGSNPSTPTISFSLFRKNKVVDAVSSWYGP
jgi:hypothetical protein